jgi:hypothetical protein
MCGWVVLAVRSPSDQPNSRCTARDTGPQVFHTRPGEEEEEEDKKEKKKNKKKKKKKKEKKEEE